MKIRNVVKTGSIGAFAVAASLLPFAATAGALASGGQTLTGIVPISPDPSSGQTVTPGKPFSSGQTVTVQAPSGSPLTPGLNVEILECAAPNGVLPTLPTQCDSETKSADTIIPAADVSFTYSNYQLYILPDPNFGASPITCGATAATECVVGMFDNFTDFTQPHIFSQPFLVNASPLDNGANPGDGTPEVPLAIGLPLAAAGLMAGGITIRRRRAARSAAA
jgi:hypothetical protein